VADHSEIIGRLSYQADTGAEICAPACHLTQLATGTRLLNVIPDDAAHLGAGLRRRKIAGSQAVHRTCAWSEFRTCRGKKETKPCMMEATENQSRKYTVVALSNCDKAFRARGETVPLFPLGKLIRSTFFNRDRASASASASAAGVPRLNNVEE
jgi:hypothetical protein